MRGATRLADVAGIEQRVCEVIVHSLCDLWVEGKAAGLCPSEIEAIEWNVNNDPWPIPTDMPVGNVVAFRR